MNGIGILICAAFYGMIVWRVGAMLTKTHRRYPKQGKNMRTGSRLPAHFWRERGMM